MKTPHPRKVTSKVVPTKSSDNKSSLDSQSLMRHAHIPSIPCNNIILFHLIALLFSITATTMQYLHLYRTVWWLPQFNSKKAMNFYLIDTDLVGYLVVMECVPFLYCIYKQLETWDGGRFWFTIALVFTLCLWITWASAFLFFSLFVYKKTQGLYLLILFYPPIAYAVIYYHFIPLKMLMKVKSLIKAYIKAILLLDYNDFEKSDDESPTMNINSTVDNLGKIGLESVGSKICPGEHISNYIAPSISTSQSDKSITSKENSNPAINGSFHRNNDYVKPSPAQAALEECGIFYFSKSIRHSSGYVQHKCSMNPEDIREEVELLKVNFNRNFRDIFFGTLFTFFYSSLVPLLFVPTFRNSNSSTSIKPKNAIHYDGLWCSQHVLVTAVTSFLLYSVQHLSPAYVDVMHRCALHLGRWRREESRSVNVLCNPWSQLQIFPKGSLVKHVKGLFKAVCVFNSAEPGNDMHNRFCYFFYPALRLPNIMCILIIIVLLFQYTLLIHNYEWYKLISVGTMMLFNIFSLYKILRNRFLLGRCYKEESFCNSDNLANSTHSMIADSPSFNLNKYYHVHSD